MGQIAESILRQNQIKEEKEKEEKAKMAFLSRIFVKSIKYLWNGASNCF